MAVDWVAVFEAAATVGAAVFAAVAAGQSSSQAKEMRSFWRIERRSEAYRAVVREPVLSLKETFLQTARDLLIGGPDSPEKMRARGADQAAIEEAKEELAERFQSEFLRYRARLRSAGLLVEGPGFADAVGASTDKLQDVVMAAIDRCDTGLDAGELESALADHSVAVDRALIEFDPVREGDGLSLPPLGNTPELER